MNVLLDTCAILFLSLGDSSVTAHTREILEEVEAVFVSPISGGELACLEEKGSIELPKHWRVWLQDAIERNGWVVIPTTLT